MGSRKNSNALRPVEGISGKIILVNLGSTKYNEINIHCRSAQKYATKRIRYK